jgi:hypothetical protein
MNWWWGKDLNLRRREPADLQSAPFDHSGTPPHYRPDPPMGRTVPTWIHHDAGPPRRQRQPTESVDDRAGEGTRTPNRLITNEMLYQIELRQRDPWCAEKQGEDRHRAPGCQGSEPGAKFEEAVEQRDELVVDCLLPTGQGATGINSSALTASLTGRIQFFLLP